MEDFIPGYTAAADATDAPIESDDSDSSTHMPCVAMGASVVAAALAVLIL
jgi:hypothetical protein